MCFAYPGNMRNGLRLAIFSRIAAAIRYDESLKASFTL